jgi:hypothetical protein
MPKGALSMFYQELVELCKGLKLTVFTLIGLIAILAGIFSEFDKTGINYPIFWMIWFFQVP